MNLPLTQQEVEALLNYLKHERGCDLTNYRRSSLMRRIEYRMQSINILSYQDYLKFLQSHCEELMALLDIIFINFSSFFRDRDTWDYFASDLIPKILASKQPHESIRVWSAGCAFGQEIYSLPILFAEALSIESCRQRVQFYATDIDEAAINQARRGLYRAHEVTGIPGDLLKKYFQKTELGYVFDQQNLRSKIVFGHHDLAQDAPMSKIDLLLCRNVLIYFNSEIQASLLSRFHFALKENGFLVLGKSETIISHKQIFAPVNLKHRVFIKRANLELKDVLSIAPKFGKKQDIDVKTFQSSIWQTAYETSPFAQLAVDFSGRLMVANKQAHLILGLTSDDWDRSFDELEIGKLLASHTSPKIFYRNRWPVTLKNIEWNLKNTKLDIFITPLFRPKKSLLGVNLTFIDASDR